MTAKLTGKTATLVQHCAVFGDLEHACREWTVSEPDRYAQHPVAVRISFVAPKKRRGASITMVPDNIRYVTIERDGGVLYDSRADVPCDMTVWQATRERFDHRPAFISHVVVP